MQTVAVLDLGTNTFHLLITRVGKAGITSLYRERIFVKLAADGIDTLSTQAMTRGLDALMRFMDKVNEFDIDLVKAVGTAALRTASNGPAYLQQIKKKTGLDVEIIDGQREAMLIYRGVREVWKPSSQPALIMDIGGGSVEYIIADTTRVLWADSFPVGVSVLHRKFHQQDPISGEEIKRLHSFLGDQLAPLHAQIRQYHPTLLIGASGTFDVVADILEFGGTLYNETVIDTKILPVIDMITQSTIDERRTHGKIPETRVDMIVVAVLLLRFTLQLGRFDKLGISAYALKEGLVSEFLD